MEKKVLIKEIKYNKANDTMYIIIDKRSGYNSGEYVKVSEVE